MHMIFFLFVLQGLYLETILWCTSFKYVHATCIVACILFYFFKPWTTISELRCCPGHLAVRFNVFFKHVLLAEQMNE